MSIAGLLTILSLACSPALAIFFGHKTETRAYETPPITRISFRQATPSDHFYDVIVVFQEAVTREFIATSFYIKANNGSEIDLPFEIDERPDSDYETSLRVAGKNEEYYTATDDRPFFKNGQLYRKAWLIRPTNTGLGPIVVKIKMKTGAGHTASVSDPVVVRITVVSRNWQDIVGGTIDTLKWMVCGDNC